MTSAPVHPNEWQQCMNDWQDALTELVTARSQALKRYAFLLCGDDAQAQDLVQDALVRTFSRTRPFTDVSGAEHYVRATILTLYLDQQRRHTTWRRIAHLLPRAEAAANHSRHSDDRHDVQAALAALSPRQRACIVLRYYEDQPIDAIASRIGCAAGTVKRHLSDALERLRPLLAEQADKELR